MTVVPTQNVCFDDAVTLAMGEAFDRTCKLLRIIGDTVTVREIIAKRIIEAAKNGERDPARLYEQALIVFGVVISVGDPPSPSLPTLRSRTQRDQKPGSPPSRAFFFY
jgi:tartrate dehydratase beta subunit/fumarate hydratase class I family protein